MTVFLWTPSSRAHTPSSRARRLSFRSRLLEQQERRGQGRRALVRDRSVDPWKRQESPICQAKVSRRSEEARPTP